MEQTVSDFSSLNIFVVNKYMEHLLKIELPSEFEPIYDKHFTENKNISKYFVGNMYPYKPKFIFLLLK